MAITRGGPPSRRGLGNLDSAALVKYRFDLQFLTWDFS